MVVIGFCCLEIRPIGRHVRVFGNALQGIFLHPLTIVIVVICRRILPSRMHIKPSLGCFVGFISSFFGMEPTQQLVPKGSAGCVNAVIPLPIGIDISGILHLPMERIQNILHIFGLAITRQSNQSFNVMLVEEKEFYTCIIHAMRRNSAQ